MLNTPQQAASRKSNTDEIAVEGLVDIELSFHGLEITLQEVIVAHVAFNALSPWAGAEHGWKTYLGKSSSRMFKGRKSIKLSAANRAWWAISGKKGKGFLEMRVLLNLWSWTHCLYVIQDPRLQERRRRSPKP